MASQAAKLGLRPGYRVALDTPPDGWTLQDPPSIEVVDHGPVDVAIAFARTRADVPSQVAAWAESIRPAGALWIAWPRRAGGHVSDITDNVVREVVLPLGLVDVKVAAIDDDWSGLKIVWRRENR